MKAMCKWAAEATTITTYEEEERVLTSFLMLALADVCRVEAASTAKATPSTKCLLSGAGCHLK